MKLTNEAISKLLKSCDLLQHRTLPAEDCMHSSTKCFTECMKVFDLDAPIAVAITFRVQFDYPVNEKGFARIYNDGTMKMWTGDDPFACLD